MTLDEAKRDLEKFVKLKTTLRPAFVDVLLNAEEVVRCKDCKYFNGNMKFCDYSCQVKDGDYCSYGERREDGKTDNC